MNYETQNEPQDVFEFMGYTKKPEGNPQTWCLSCRVEGYKLSEKEKKKAKWKDNLRHPGYLIAGFFMIGIIGGIAGGILGLFIAVVISGWVGGLAGFAIFALIEYAWIHDDDLLNGFSDPFCDTFRCPVCGQKWRTPKSD